MTNKLSILQKIRCYLKFLFIFSSNLDCQFTRSDTVCPTINCVGLEFNPTYPATEMEYASSMVLSNPALIVFSIVQVRNLNGNIKEQGGTLL